MGFWLALGLMVPADGAGAQAPERSLLPMQRPVVAPQEGRAAASSGSVSPTTTPPTPGAAPAETTALTEPARDAATGPVIEPSILAPSIPTFSLAVPQSETSSVTGPARSTSAAPHRSPHPIPRPERNQTQLPGSTTPLQSTLPEIVAADDETAAEPTDINPHAPALSVRPVRRSAAALARFTQAAQPVAQTSPPVAAGGGSAAPAGGGLCGLSTLEGRRLSGITSPVQGCGVAEPVSVTAVAGVRLSQPATLDCDTARAFDRWVRQVMQPAMGRSGGGVAQIRVAAHYTCRPRNNRAGARVSEHGRGRAIDVAGFRLANGQTVMVLSDWQRGPHRDALRQMHASACGIFRTTLGPGSDGHHEDHFHFDMADRRGGSTYCR